MLLKVDDLKVRDEPLEREPTETERISRIMVRCPKCHQAGPSKLAALSIGCSSVQVDSLDQVCGSHLAQ